MTSRFRIVFLLSLCLTLLVSGCSMLEKQRLPFSTQDDVAIWMSSLAGLSPEEQGRRADVMRKSPGASLALRDKALSIAACRPGAQGFPARTELNRIYTTASPLQRGAWEALLWTDLDSMDDASLRTLASKISPAQEQKFPWNLVMLKAARRGLAPDSSAALNRLSVSSLYAAPQVLGLMASQPVENGPVYAALVLPQNGAASALGRQIAAGALAAADMLQARGRTVDIRIIDTAQADWQQTLKALPPEFAMVGGPLLPGQAAAVKQAAQGRAVFTFTNPLPEGEEGSAIWRFFSSPQDQVRALLDGAGSIGITSFGIFSPGDSYGKRMSATFEQEAASRGFPVTLGSYTADNMSAWTKEAGTFLKTEVGEQRGSIPIATADFKGIFLTDSWKNMDMLVSSLHYSGAHSKLMLGTSLWEQNLGENSRSNAATFSLTLFPASWNASDTGAGAAAFRAAMAARGARTDDWSVLGFDFVQLASVLCLQPGWSPAMLNGWLAEEPNVEWAGAPMTWNAAGLVSRRLFLLTPASVGSAPADLDAMRERILSREADAQMVFEAQAEENQKNPLSFDQLVDSITKK